MKSVKSEKLTATERNAVVSPAGKRSHPAAGAIYGVGFGGPVAAVAGSIRPAIPFERGYNALMRYRLRTLMIAGAVGPPALAFALRHPDLAAAIIASEVILFLLMLFAYRFLL